MNACDIRDEVSSALRAKRCWYVSCGGSAVATFELALGEKIPRRDTVQGREKDPSEFDRFEGEANLLVWCSWRLDDRESPISSSDDTNENVVASLRKLTDKIIENVKIDLPGWDLRLDFSDGLVLHVFSDHVPPKPSFDGNWDLFLADRTISIGAGSKPEVERRCTTNTGSA